ncbi:tetratricopeptide repeat protein [Bacillus ndiopicus]|uniref:tetratricopeptide repeat protein n=1 Tax=Bacillus ndiopicus TaxID=1347368 RepID=UPI0005A85D6B|nr:tetratricopeptide repeat protein [Bacillus ndiopicus]
MENKEQKKENIVSFVPTGDYYYEKAIKALEKEQIDKAYKYLKRAEELNPADVRVLTQYGLLEIEAQNYEHAYELIHTAHSLEPSDAEIIFLLADVSGCLGLMSDAKKYAEQYLAQEPDGMYALDAYEILDFVEYEQNISEDVDEQEAEKLIAQEKARRLMEKGTFPKAIEVLEELIEKFPDAWPAYNNLSLAYFYIGEAEQAHALLKHVLRENHGNLHALCNLAVFAYYEKAEEELKELMALLKKIQPYDWENRYKLGATLALIGEYETAYKWLRSMHKRGYEGDPGFYYWLAQSAYFSQQEEIAKVAWQSLLALDPSKEGLEPWHMNALSSEEQSLEKNRELIIEKINSKYTSDRLFGLFILKHSPHKQEIIAHPKWIEIEEYNEVEKLCLAYSLGHQFERQTEYEKSFVRFLEVAEKLLEVHGQLNYTAASALQLWFSIGELALRSNYAFKNPIAIAAAIDYMLQSAMGDNVTKKKCAENYEVSVATLTKYMTELLAFVPTEFE